MDEDVVGAVPTGDAPTSSEWSTGFFCLLRGLMVIDKIPYTEE